MLKLVPDRDHCPPFGKADAEQLCKLGYHKCRLVVSLPFYHPCDRLQRIIEEMRIDLALQRVQLALSSLCLLHDDLLHKTVDLLIGPLDGVSEMADLR